MAGGAVGDSAAAHASQPLEQSKNGSMIERLCSVLAKLFCGDKIILCKQSQEE